MLIDVQDPVGNLILNLCFAGIALMTLLALIPWGLLGMKTLERSAVWLPIPVLALAVVYEWVMPSNYNIRIDLFLLLPAYGLVLFASVIRRIVRWRDRRKRKTSPGLEKPNDRTT